MRELTEQERRHLAAAIAAGRGALGMSQSDLAEAAGVSTSTVSNYERGLTGKLRTMIVQPIARALGWSNSDIDQILATGAVPEPEPVQLAPLDQVLEELAGRPLTAAERRFLTATVDGALRHLNELR